MSLIPFILIIVIGTHISRVLSFRKSTFSTSRTTSREPKSLILRDDGGLRCRCTSHRENIVADSGKLLHPENHSVLANENNSPLSSFSDAEDGGIKAFMNTSFWLLNSVAIIWGTQHVVIKSSLSTFVSPAVLNLWRFALSATLFSPALIGAIVSSSCNSSVSYAYMYVHFICLHSLLFAPFFFLLWCVV
jgi:hypothetical protein